MKSSITAAAET